MIIIIKLEKVNIWQQVVRKAMKFYKTKENGDNEKNYGYYTCI